VHYRIGLLYLLVDLRCLDHGSGDEKVGGRSWGATRFMKWPG